MNRFAPSLAAILLILGCQPSEPPAAPDPSGPHLPAGMKGWELYTWEDSEQTWFTLVDGTNRNKTASEVFSGPRDISTEYGGTITVAGLDAVAGVLARLPAGETIIVVAVRYPSTELDPIETPVAIERHLRGVAAQLGLVLP